MTAEMSRRRLLAMGATATGGAAATSLLPPSLVSALAAPAPRGGLESIEHVVLLMQENRAFDHYFGMLRGVRGYQDRNAVRLRDGRDVFAQGDRDDPVLPFSVRQASKQQKQDAQYVDSLDHSWDTGHHAWHEGWMDRWVDAKTASTMAYYDRGDIAFQYELADTFTVCDAYHSALHSSTSPNRNYFFTGWTGTEPLTGKRAVDNDAYEEDVHPGYDWTTYPERLEEAGVSWKVYSEWDNFTDNQLDFYATFKKIARKALSTVGDYPSLTAFYEDIAKKKPDQRDALLAKLEQGVRALPAAQRSLYRRGLHRGKPGSLASEFRKDVAAGTLPAVTYLVPNSEESEHPSASTPLHSATVTYKVLDALAAHPEVWRKTAVLISFDENDGFFDHVPPPIAPRDVHDEWYDGKPVGLGMRVPMTVVSPWSVGGYVCSELFDHTSQIRFLERRFGVRDSNISSWRRQVCGDLTGAFDFSRGRLQPALHTPDPPHPKADRWHPEPPEQSHMPTQEHGTRPARPVPYQPEASGHLDEEGKHLRLSLGNSGQASAHVVLFPYAGEYATPQHRDLPAGSSSHWDVSLPGGRYELTLVGPNGFRREFAGSAGGRAAHLKATAEPDPADHVLRVTLSHSGRQAVTCTVRPQAYEDTEPKKITLRAGEDRTVRWDTRSAHGWYDLKLTVAEDEDFHRRLAGHVEDGTESVSG